MAQARGQGRDVLVIGGGPAGIAAAAEAAGAGLSVTLCEQRRNLGGAIHRQRAGGGKTLGAPRSVRDQWKRLSGLLENRPVEIRTRHVFLGVDGDGLVLLDDRAKGRVAAEAFRAVILAVGAVERVRPRPGWELPGVMTAGGLQVMMKERGAAPAGRILVAGNGPLPIALAAQLAAAGNAPVALVASGDPVRHFAAGLGLAAHPRLAFEALGYLAALRAGGVPWRRGTELASIERRGSALRATLVDRAGASEAIEADLIALHDGIGENVFGLPAEGQAGRGPVILRAGDCREALGAIAAEADGRRAARRVVAHLRGAPAPDATHERMIGRERSAQAMLARLFRPVADLPAPPNDTTLCRCEGKTLGDLRRLLDRPDPVSPREIKLVGRFGMGACQGRFCARNTLAQAGREGADTATLTGARWPGRPVSIASILSSGDPDDAGEPELR